MRSYSICVRSRFWLSWSIVALAVSGLFAPASAAATADEQPAGIRNAPGRISGRVVRDRGGDPVAGAAVMLLPPVSPGLNWYVWPPVPLRHTLADGQGKFTFEKLPPGKYWVWANHEKLTSWRDPLRGERVIIPEVGEQPKPLELRMFPGVAVTALVKSQATRKAIPKAVVHFRISNLKDNNFATDNEGRVTIQPLPPQRWIIQAWADGFAVQSRSLNLESGSDAEVEFLLGPGGDIAGVVRDPAGKPVSDVRLTVRNEGDYHLLMNAKTDDQGHYRLDHLPLDVPVQVSLLKLEYVNETLTARALAVKQSLDLTIRPRPHGGSIAGAVVDRNGRPVVGAEIVNMGGWSAEVRKTITGQDGRFLLENLYEGGYEGRDGPEVTVRAKNFAPLKLKVKPGPADKPAELDIVLDPGHTLKGRVEDEIGGPLEEVAVYFADAPSDGGDTRTDKRGRFDLDSLPADCLFSFVKAGYSRIGDRQLPLDSPDVIAVTMSPPGVIQGKVVDAKTGKSITKLRVRITHSPNRKSNDPSGFFPAELVDPGETFHSEHGKFQIADLPLGMPLQVMVDAEGYERAVRERIVAERSDQAVSVEFTLVPIDPASLTTYSGRLRDAHGRPVAGAVLRLIAARDRQSDRRTDFPFNWEMIRSGQLSQQTDVLRFLEGATSASGRFEFPRVPKQAEVELAWWGTGIPSGRSDHLELLDEKGRAAIKIDLPAPGSIKGRIDRDTYPKIGMIWIRSSDGRNESRELLLKPDQKSFEVGGLAPGEYTVGVMSPVEPVPGRRGSLTSKALSGATVVVEAGKTVEIP